MTILVTGGAGFIGSHVVDALLGRGDSVVVIDDLNDYYDRSIKAARIEGHKKNDKYLFEEADIRDLQKLASIFRRHKITSIIHLAARAGVRPSLTQPELYFETNVLGTLYILELAKEHGVKNIVAASSSSVYGNSKDLPYNEDQKTDKPVSPYAASKVAMEALCYSLSHVHNLNITCLRFFTVYGPGGRPDMAPFLFMDAIAQGKPITVCGDGSTSRDYTFIADIVAGVIAAHDKPHKFEVFNLGNSKTVTLNEMIATIESVVGKKAIKIAKPLQTGDVEHTFADVSKAKKMLGYNPTTSLKDGMSKMYAWYVENH